MRDRWVLIAATTACLGLATGCGSHHAAAPAATGSASTATSLPPSPTAQPSSASTSGPASSPSASPTASPSGAVSGAATGSPASVSFAVVSGYYVAGTADGGQLYVRADGASRYTSPDPYACPSCSTATEPIAHLDISLSSLTRTATGGYVVTGVVTAESDPAWASHLGPSGAGPVGTPVSFTISDAGVLTGGFLPATDPLARSATG